MPPSSPIPYAALIVPVIVSTTARTMLTMMLNRTNIQYSLRRDRPLNTAYFFSTSRYQFMHLSLVALIVGYCVPDLARNGVAGAL